MAGFIDSRFGIFPDALRVHEKSAEIISANLAHEHTPNYKAKALDFRTALADCKDKLYTSSASGSLSNRNSVGLPGIQSKNGLVNHIKYREVSQVSLDGNTVDGQREESAYAENSIRYLASLSFLGERAKELMLAIKGT